MKASVYYQDLGLNSCVFGNNEKLRIDTLHASFIGEVHASFIGEVVIGIEDKIAFADKVFRILNTEPETLFSQDKFKEIGHTSMSVGDYLYFEEDNTQTILICASCGWKVLDDEFLKRRDKVIDTIYSLPIGTIEGIYELLKKSENEVVTLLSNTFSRDEVKIIPEEKKERDTWQQTEILQHKINYNFYQEGLTLGEMDIEHITDLIKDGYIEGELDRNGVEGYWEIDK